MSFFGIDIPACFACENTSKSLNSAPRSQQIPLRNVSFFSDIAKWRRRVCCPNHFFAGVNRSGSTSKGGGKCGVGITFTSTARDELVFSSTAKINSIRTHIHTITSSPCSAHSSSHCSSLLQPRRRPLSYSYRLSLSNSASLSSSHSSSLLSAF
jgi:hypothetical protein